MLKSFLRGMSVATLAVGTIAISASAATVLENRAATMKGLGGNLKAIGAVAKGKAEYSPALIGNAKALVQYSKNIEVLFPQGSTGKRTKPEIWTDWAGFVKAAEALEAAAPGLLAAVESGDKGKIGAATGAVGKTCGGCHKPYRAPKKK
jgi:cytochrome c556